MAALRLEPAGNHLRIGTSKWFGAPANSAIIESVASSLGTVPEAPAVTGFSPRMFLAPRSVDVMIGVRPGGDQTMASEWDFAVADLVFHEAGGMVTDLSGQPFRYNKPVPRNFGGLIAAADPASHARVLAALQAQGEWSSPRTAHRSYRIAFIRVTSTVPRGSCLREVCEATQAAAQFGRGPSSRDTET